MQKIIKNYRTGAGRLGLTGGFTVLELFLAIAIVGILALLAVNVHWKAREMTEGATCLSHLRQIGVAIHSYASEHNGVLPGAMVGHQRATTTGTGMSSAKAHLIDYLAPYLGVPHLVGSQSYTSPLFACPAALNALKKEGRRVESPLTYVHLSTWFANEKSVRAFGYQDKGREVIPPARIASLEAPGRTLALVDSDGELLSAPSAPLRPAHGRVRHVLFVDGHAAVVPVEHFEIRSIHLYIKP